MTKKVIQVPVDEELLIALNKMSRKQSRARAELIRTACQRYLEALETEELDRIYREGYERIPEDTNVGETQIAMISEIVPKETW